MTSPAEEFRQRGIQNKLKEIIQEIEQEVGGEPENDVTSPKAMIPAKSGPGGRVPKSRTLTASCSSDPATPHLGSSSSSADVDIMEDRASIPPTETSPQNMSNARVRLIPIRMVEPETNLAQGLGVGTPGSQAVRSAGGLDAIRMSPSSLKSEDLDSLPRPISQEISQGSGLSIRQGSSGSPGSPFFSVSGGGRSTVPKKVHFAEEPDVQEFEADWPLSQGGWQIGDADPGEEDASQEEMEEMKEMEEVEENRSEEHSWKKAEENSDMHGDMEQVTHVAQSAERLLSQVMHDPQMEEPGWHVDEKHIRVLGDEPAAQTDDHQGNFNDEETPLPVNVADSVPPGFLTSAPFSSDVSPCRNSALQLGVLCPATETTASSEVSSEGRLGNKVSQKLPASSMLEVSGALSIPDESASVLVSESSMAPVSETTRQRPLQAVDSHVSSGSSIEDDIKNSTPSSASSVPSQPLSQMKMPDITHRVSTPGDRSQNTRYSPPTSSQRMLDITSPPSSSGSSTSAPTLPLFTPPPPAANVQRPCREEGTTPADCQLPERPLSPLIRLLLRGISNRSARPYGRTSPLFVRGGERKSPFRTVKEKNDGHRNIPKQTLPLPTFIEPAAEPPSETANLHEPGSEPSHVDTSLIRNIDQPSQSDRDTPTVKPAAPQPPPPPPPPQESYKRPRKSKALFVDSAFFSARDHPTWEEQVKMARRIASSLSDATNRHSRGQSMYEKRQKRSPRWIHQGGVPLTSEDYRGPTVTEQTKPLLELVMNPQGQLLDLESLRDKGVIVNTEGLSPELCSEIIRDLHAASGRGGQLFARRKKRAERWIVDEFHPEISRPGERPTTQLPQPRPRHVPLYGAETTPAEETRPETVLEEETPPVYQPPEGLLPGVDMTIPPVRLGDLWSPSQPARFPTDGVYSPRTPQGWRSPGTAPPFAAPVFPEHVEPPVADTVADMAAPTIDTLPDMEPTDTWDWAAQQLQQEQEQLQQQLQQQQQLQLQQRREPPPAATLFQSPLESLKAMEERRRQGQSNYTPQAWSDRSAHCQPASFTVT